MPNFKNLGHSLQKELYGNGNKTTPWAFKPIEGSVFFENEDLQPRMHNLSKRMPEPLGTDLYDSDSESRTSSSDEQDDTTLPIMQTLQFLGKP